MKDELTKHHHDELAMTARESFDTEAQYAAAIAWSHEQRNYELLLKAFRGWILQRRHTTELIEPAIKQGRPKGDAPRTFLADFGFTRSQWYRRRKELEVSEAEIDAYMDLCIEQGRTPSLYGLLRAVSEVATRSICTCGRPHLPDCPAKKGER